MLTDAQYKQVCDKLKNRKTLGKEERERLKAVKAEYEALKKQLPGIKISEVDPAQAAEVGKKIKKAQKVKKTK